MREETSICRLCFGYCGVKITIDDHGHVVQVRGDHDNPVTQGFACIKGLEAPAGMYGEKRLVRPLKRIGGVQVPIPLEQALAEIAARMHAIREEDGPQALAFYRGTGTMGSTIATLAFPALANAVGGQFFSTMTIDQSAKWVTADRLGVWAAGRHSLEDSDVWLFAGSNPLVSVFAWRTPTQNPMKALKRARERGTKIIVIDPRQCEVAKHADIHLQIYPGEDVTVAAGLIHIILANGWEDAEFCRQHVAGLDELRAAVAPFTPEWVAARAGIAAHDLVAVADVFARQARHGTIETGTGVSMARFPNLAEHLYEVITIICGRFLHAGDKLPNPGVIYDKRVPRAEAIAPKRRFEKEPRSRVRGAVRLNGEAATPTLAEEILTPGAGRIRSLVVSGANPAVTMPDRASMVEALQALDLLVVIDPFETATTLMADYVLPPTFMYEHADMTFSLEMTNLAIPYAQYTPPLTSPPADSELCDEGYVAWVLAKGLGSKLNIMGVEMDTETAPGDEDFLRIMARNGIMPFDEFKQSARHGQLYDLPPKYVQPASDRAGRFEVMPPDVAQEVEAFLATDSTAETLAHRREFDLRLIPRRIREVSNASYHHFPTARSTKPYNPLCAHPDDLKRLNIEDGDSIEVVSVNGRIQAIAKADATLKSGVVSMTHGYGGMPGEPVNYAEHGAATSMLVSVTRDCEPLQGMPLLSGVLVRIEPV